MVLLSLEDVKIMLKYFLQPFGFVHFCRGSQTQCTKYKVSGKLTLTFNVCPPKIFASHFQQIFFSDNTSIPMHDEYVTCTLDNTNFHDFLKIII